MSAAALCWLGALGVVAALYGAHAGAVVASPYNVGVEAWALWWMLATPPALLCELLAWLRRRLGPAAKGDGPPWADRRSRLRNPKPQPAGGRPSISRTLPSRESLRPAARPS